MSSIELTVPAKVGVASGPRPAREAGSPFPSVERRRGMTAEEFRRNYRGRRSVVLSGLTDDWAAVTEWTGAHLADVAGDMRVKVKPGYIPEGEVDFLNLGRYAEIVEGYEALLSRGEERPPEPPAYLHDIPLLAMVPRLVEDVQPFPVALLPRWYRSRWWRFAQFFYGPTHSLTPLHFDTLGTHNLFFQVKGRKRFIIISSEERRRCYMYGWRWSEVDPEAPDFDRHPAFTEVTPQEALVGPGDVLYMPPGTLHHVRSLDESISFNIDWHTRRSAYAGMAGVLQGMPWKNFYYNAVVALGLTTGISSRALYPLYRSYLDYIS